ncbi:Hypothetical predicted protein [Olea europaea subsp. europaea]|uniref:Uncharacterized protein n=1 Tax=Olea europaea subsp. europaea TaxID=158383 RepID=A0A8S0SV05_OLEEU|nr:Hypothetical predicted protein [Olea europaea subsp. europaea]
MFGLMWFSILSPFANLLDVVFVRSFLSENCLYLSYLPCLILQVCFILPILGNLCVLSVKTCGPSFLLIWSKTAPSAARHSSAVEKFSLLEGKKSRSRKQPIDDGSTHFALEFGKNFVPTELFSIILVRCLFVSS